MNMKIRISRKGYGDYIFSILIILLPFLYQYKGIGSIITLGELLLIPFIIGYLIKDLIIYKGKKIDKWLFGFYLIAILMTFFNISSRHFSMQDAMTGIVRLVYYMALVYVARFHFKLDKVKDIYLTLVFVFSLYLIAQFLYHYASGGYLPIYLNYNWQFPPDARPATYSGIYAYGFRPSSLFLEASYFAMFVLPGIAFLLFGKNKNKGLNNIIILCVSCSAIVLSTSSAGLIGLGILFILKVLRDNNGKRSTFQKIAVVLLGILIIGFVLYAENAYTLRSRLFSGGSIGQRVLRGIIVFNDLDTIHKIIGVGMNNMGAYMTAHHLSTIYDEGNLNNCASIIQSFVYFGIVGGSALIAYIISFLKKSKGNIGFPLAVLVTYMLSYEATLFMYRFAFLMILLEAVNKFERGKKHEHSNRCESFKN